MYEREHRIAETLQRSLLPEHLPQLPGLSVAARYLPAAAEAEVGGDWYDVLPTPSGGVGLVMGDVAGKGLAAASMVGRLRSALRAYALEGHAPARVVEQLNRLIWTEEDESQMATLIYVVVDPVAEELRWVNAGHPPPLLLSDGDVPQFLKGGSSVPLGVLPFPEFEEASARIEQGATVVLYTDGLVERPGEHIDDGLERLADVVRVPPPAIPRSSAIACCASWCPTAERPTTSRCSRCTRSRCPTASASSCRLSPRRSPRCARCCDAGCATWAAEQDISEIVTACGEAATNAIEHAGAGAPFEISGQLDGPRVEIAVRDFGAWREPREGDHGRGLSLMEALMDTVDVTPTPEGTTVRLRRTLLPPNSNGDGQ